MSERIHALAQRLLGKPTIEECDLQEIEILVQRFPYFAPAQFLLLEKLKQTDADAYAVQAQKSILYYHNPLEFQYFIHPDRFYTEINFDEEEQPADLQAPRLEEPEASISEQTPVQFVEPEIPAYGEPVTDTSPDDNPPTHTDDKPESSWQPVTTEQEPIHITHDEQQPAVDTVSLNAEPGPQQEAEVLFEPFHTVDYFASQGIRLSQEEIPKDKFGRQLKSFTEWLKTMKRISPAQPSTGMDPRSENSVQHLAEDSIHDASVITEAMAEVWIKQGNAQKAIEVYNKLSLLNPSKRAYFATKIENLKRS
jgi:hypothetical protein